jgi:hypothetical protein
MEASNYELTHVWMKDGITYVPHYRDRTLFVGPGYPMGPGNPKMEHCYTVAELLNAGATQAEMPLWPRPQFATTASN